MCSPDAAHYQALRRHLEAATAIAYHIDPELTQSMRTQLLDMLDEVSFLQAIHDLRITDNE